MPSNISSGDGLWTSAGTNLKDMSIRKPRKSRGAPMKERLSNYSDNDDSGISQTSSQSGGKEESGSDGGTLPTSPTFHTQQSVESNGSSLPGNRESTSPTPIPIANGKKTIFSRLKKVSLNGANNSLDVFHFEGEGLQFRGKLIGIKDVEEARGDEMCQSAMTELVKSLKQSKEHKPRINISVSLAGLKIKDDKGTIVMHQHPIPKISYIWRDQTDLRAFGYVYGTPDAGHRFFAIKAEKSADGLVGAIHRLFQVAFRMKQHEIDLAKKGQDDTSSNGSGDGSSSRKKENAEGINGGGDGQHGLTNGHKVHSHNHAKVDEANLLDLESELQVLSQGLEQINEVQSHTPHVSTNEWIADFGGNDHISSGSSSTSSGSDPWGRELTPQSFRTITPDPFETMIASRQPPALPTRPNAHTPWNHQGAADPQSFGIVPQAQSLSSSYPTMMNGHDNPFAVPATPYPSPAHPDLGSNAMMVNGGFSDPFSVFDRAAVNDVKMSTSVDVFSSELFGDLCKVGAPREEKTSRKTFPQPIKPKLGDLRGEPTVIAPSPSTIDPFIFNASSFNSDTFSGSSVGSNIFGSSFGDGFAQEGTHGGHSGITRKISVPMFPTGGSPPPLIPPRPNNSFTSMNAFIVQAPPPAPRRSSNAPPVVSALGLSLQQPVVTAKTNDPFGDNFFDSR